MNTVSGSLTEAASSLAKAASSLGSLSKSVFFVFYTGVHVFSRLPHRPAASTLSAGACRVPAHADHAFCHCASAFSQGTSGDASVIDEGDLFDAILNYYSSPQGIVISFMFYFFFLWSVLGGMFLGDQDPNRSLLSLLDRFRRERLSFRRLIFVIIIPILLTILFIPVVVVLTFSFLFSFLVVLFGVLPLTIILFFYVVVLIIIVNLLVVVPISIFLNVVSFLHRHVLVRVLHVLVRLLHLVRSPFVLADKKKVETAPAKSEQKWTFAPLVASVSVFALAGALCWVSPSEVLSAASLDSNNVPARLYMRQGAKTRRFSNGRNERPRCRRPTAATKLLAEPRACLTPVWQWVHGSWSQRACCGQGM